MKESSLRVPLSLHLTAFNFPSTMACSCGFLYLMPFISLCQHALTLDANEFSWTTNVTECQGR